MDAFRIVWIHRLQNDPFSHDNLSLGMGRSINSEAGVDKFINVALSAALYVDTPSVPQWIVQIVQSILAQESLHGESEFTLTNEGPCINRLVPMVFITTSKAARINCISSHCALSVRLAPNECQQSISHPVA